MKKYIEWIIGILVLTAVVIIVVKVKGNRSVVPVETIQTKEVQVKKSVSTSGIVESRNKADLAFSSGGTLEEIYVKEGDDIKQGDLIAYISNVDTQQTANSYKKALDAAKKDLEIYIENYSTNLSAAGGEDEYYLNVKKLEDLVDKAEASYQSTLASHMKTQIYAPFDSTVMDVYKDESEVVSIGESIVKLANLNQNYFEISVDQEDFAFVKEGQSVEVTLDSYEDEMFTGYVSEFSKYIDETTSDFIVKIDFDKLNKDKILLGMEGDANIIVEKTESPVSALVFDQVFTPNGETYVWIVENKKLKKFPVEIGLEGDIYTEIKTNLSDKKVVLPTETENIKEGARVKVTK